MSLARIQWNPTDRQLQQFGTIGVFALPMIGWFATSGNMRVTLAMAVVGLCGGVAACWRPRWLKIPFIALSVITFPISCVLSEISMLIAYFGVIVPTSLILRCLRREGISRQFDRTVESYWRERKKPSSAANYYRLF